ncbi:MAG: CBS domain-containing protein [Calditrichia bacterium]
MSTYFSVLSKTDFELKPILSSDREMLVQRWMTHNVVTVDPEDPISLLCRLFEHRKFRRVPVFSHSKLVGIVTERDLQAALPSRFYYNYKPGEQENYLHLKVKDIMTREVITIHPRDTIEKAAILMRDHKIGGLPVVEDDQLVGIITQHDVFEALLEITGARWNVPRLTLIIDDRPGSVKEITDIIRKYPAKILSLLVTKIQMSPDKREVTLRIHSEHLSEIVADLRKRYGEVVIRETV